MANGCKPFDNFLTPTIYIYIYAYQYNIFIGVYFSNVDSVLNISLLPSGLSKNTVGQQQDVICSLSLLPNLDSNDVDLGWLYEERIITADNRVTINSSSNYFNDSILVTSIHFDPLIEKDEYEYFCYAIINGSFVVESIYLHRFTSKLIN